MHLNKVHNFFFHPFHAEHTHPTKVLSIAAVIALSVFSRGVFAVAFALVNCYEYWQSYEVDIKKEDPKVEKAARPIRKNLNANARVKKNSPAVQSEKPVFSKAKVDRIKKHQSLQLKLFEKWAKGLQWRSIHAAHYDWWMFPVEHSSRRYGESYAVGKGEVEALKADPKFMNDYRRGVILVVHAWGWDLEKGEAIASPAKNQKWTGYGVRLAKMSDSLRLFGEIELHQKLQLFFKKHCLPQQKQVPISDLAWLKSTLL